MAFDSSAIRPAIDDLPAISDLEDRVADLETDIELLDDVPTSTSIDEIVVLTQAAYDGLTPDVRTLYVVVG